jgi:hypothetical protein
VNLEGKVAVITGVNPESIWKEIAELREITNVNIRIGEEREENEI